MENWEKQIDWGEILVAQQGALDEIHRLREENARLQRRAEEASIDFAEASRERDEARAEARTAEASRRAHIERTEDFQKEIERLEGLILDWWDAPEGKTAETATALCIEARRIRAQREGGE